jgi:hypothetical protein
MAQIRVERDTLAEMLRSPGEDDLAARASSITDDELTRIRTLGAYYAWSEDALALHGSMGGARARSLATIDVLERTGRDPRRHHTDSEIAFGWSQEPDASERARDRKLRLHARRNSCPTRAAERRRIRSAGAVLCGRSRTPRPRAFGYRLLRCLSPSAQTFRRPAGS